MIILFNILFINKIQKKKKRMILKYNDNIHKNTNDFITIQ